MQGLETCLCPVTKSYIWVRQRDQPKIRANSAAPSPTKTEERAMTEQERLWGSVQVLDKPFVVCLVGVVAVLLARHHGFTAPDW